MIGDHVHAKAAPTVSRPLLEWGRYLLLIRDPAFPQRVREEPTEEVLVGVCVYIPPHVYVSVWTWDGAVTQPS